MSFPAFRINDAHGCLMLRASILVRSGNRHVLGADVGAGVERGYDLVGLCACGGRIPKRPAFTRTFTARRLQPRPLFLDSH